MLSNGTDSRALLLYKGIFKKAATTTAGKKSSRVLKCPKCSSNLSKNILDAREKKISSGGSGGGEFNSARCGANSATKVQFLASVKDHVMLILGKFIIP